MFSKSQISLIHAVSTILMQESDFNYWVNDLKDLYVSTNIRGTRFKNGSGPIYCLAMTKIEDRFFLVITKPISVSEYDDDEYEPIILGLLPIKQMPHNEWNIARYCRQVCDIVNAHLASDEAEI